MFKVERFEFHKEITTPQDGKSYNITSADSILLDFSGTATSFTAEILGSITGEVGTFKPIGDSYNKTSLSTGYQIDTKDDFISVPLSGLGFIMVKVTAISGGNLNVLGSITRE